jgi:hypothetical protein
MPNIMQLLIIGLTSAAMSYTKLWLNLTDGAAGLD